MKRGICIAVSALLLAAPVQAQARVSGYEVREVPHTFTVKMGADGLTKDGEAVTLPEGAEPYQKDGVLMMAAEPFLKALAEDVSLVWHKFDEEVLYVFWGNYLITFDAAQKELYSGRIHSLIVPDMERRGTQLFLPLRDWADLLPEFYCEAQGISWDAKTRTATLQYMAAELETKGELPTPSGEGAAPEYILQPTQEYTRIKNLGGGYFSAFSGIPERKTFILDSTGEVLQSYERGFDIQYTGEGLFEITEHGSRKEGGYIADKNGRKIFETDRNDVVRFSEGLSRTQTGSGTGFLNTKGEVVIPAEYFDAKNFSEGLAAVSMLDTTMIDDWHAGRRWGYVDKEGTLVIDMKYTSCGSFHEGLAYACSSDKLNGKYGYIDKAGQEVIAPQYDSAGNFCNGKALVMEGKGTENGRLWAIDRTGKKLKLIAETPVLVADDILGGCVVATQRSAMLHGDPMSFLTYYNADGELSYAESIWVQNASEDLMTVQDEKTGKWGYVDKDWHWAIAPIFDDVEKFQDGYAVVYQKTEQGDMAKGIIKKP